MDSQNSYIEFNWLTKLFILGKQEIGKIIQADELTVTRDFCSHFL
jgi:hypothetical protein